MRVNGLLIGALVLLAGIALVPTGSAEYRCTRHPLADVCAGYSDQVPGCPWSVVGASVHLHGSGKTVAVCLEPEPM